MIIHNQVVLYYEKDLSLASTTASPSCQFGISELSFGINSEIIDHKLKSPFVHLCCFVGDLSTLGNGQGGSEQIREGAQISQKPPTDDVERFVFMVRFDSNGKVITLAMI